MSVDFSSLRGKSSSAAAEAEEAEADVVPDQLHTDAEDAADPAEEEYYASEEDDRDVQSTSEPQPVASLEPDKDLSREQRGREGSAEQSGSPIQLLGPLLALAAVVLGGLLVGKLLGRGKRRRRRQPGAPLLTRLQLPPAQAAPPPAAPPLLAGLEFAVADVFDIKGEVTSCGLHSSSSEAQPAIQTASAVSTACAAGATGVGRAASYELHVSILGSQVGDGAPENPAAPSCWPGGAGGSCAAAVAGGQVDFAVGTDHLAGIRVASACCGVYGYRPSHGLVAADGGASVTPSLETVAWAVRDPALLPALGRANGLPGGGASARAELAEVILAQDLFAVCEDGVGPAYTAFLAAAKRWAGPEQVQRVPLCQYLLDHVPALQAFRQDEGTKVLHALRDAAVTIQMSELRATLLQGPAPAPGSPLATALQQAEQVSEEVLAAARQVAAQMAIAMRQACTRGVVLVLPTLPGPAPPRDAPPADVEAFEDKALQFTSIAALAGLPQVTIPVVLPGVPPTSVSLLGLQKSDMRLLQIAAKLGPKVAEIALKAHAKPDAPKKAKAAVANGVSKRPKKAGNPGKRVPNGQAAEQAKAEGFKARGNELFKAGDYEGAMHEYSAAIMADPGNPVLWSNRAMAALKVMQFEQAEGDCNQALRLELSAKALLRRGTARLGLQRIAEARKDFHQVIALEPNNRQARVELENLKHVPDEFFGTDSGVASFDGEAPPMNGDFM